MSAIPSTHATFPPRKSFAQVAAAANVVLTQKEKPTNKSNTPRNISIQPQASITEPVTHAERSTKPVTNGDATHPQLSGRHDASVNEPQQLHVLLQRVQLHSDSVSPVIVDLISQKEHDTKSVASRTTLTLDEKESLRPDDSASMQAGQEEDVLSPSGSIVAESRQSTDPDVKAFREQLNAIDRTGVAVAIPSHAPVALPLQPVDGRTPGIVSAPQVVVPVFPVLPAALPEGAQALPSLFVPTPDEKLLEALASPKDRLFVLKVEQDMIDFIRDSKEEFLQLPQTNSFYRMLSHKLADYYLLGHLVDDSMTSVRIFRTPHSQLPPPLIGPASTGDGSTPPPNGPARMIMRRGGEGSGATTSRNGDVRILRSHSSSKAPSDTGAGSGADDANEDILKGKDKSSMTREERERMYKEARARIFKDFKEEAVDGVESAGGSAEKEVSRSSSASGIKKTKKSKKPKDDGFDPRSSYSQFGNQAFQPNTLASPTSDGSFNNPFAPYAFGIINMSPIRPQDTPLQASAPSYYPFSPQDPSAMSAWSAGHQGIGYMVPQTPAMQYFDQQTDYDSSNLYGSTMQSYPSPEMSNRATPKAVPSTLAGYSTSYGPPASMGWTQHPQTGYGMNGYQSPNGMADTTYLNGQMMYSPNAPYTGMQSPEHYFMSPTANAFNPRSQSFVPSFQGNMATYAQNGGPGMMFPSNTSTQMINDLSQRQFPSISTHNSNSNTLQFSQQLPLTNTARSNSQIPSYRASGQQTIRQAQTPVQGSASGSFSNSISKWGDPSTLPPKPPRSAVPPAYFENQQPLPPNPYSQTAARQAVGHDAGAQVAH